MAPPGQGGNPTAIRPAIASSASAAKYRRHPATSSGGRIGIHQTVVLIRAQRLLAARLASKHQPAIRNGRPALTPLDQGSFRLREDPHHQAIVQLGDDARDVPHAPAIVHEALHQRRDAAGAAGQLRTR